MMKFMMIWLSIRAALDWLSLSRCHDDLNMVVRPCRFRVVTGVGDGRPSRNRRCPCGGGLRRRRVRADGDRVAPGHRGACAPRPHG